jgi:hypothetical protein
VSRISELLPTLQRCDRLQLEQGDVLVHAPGFEDRTMAVCQRVECPVQAHAVLLDYLPPNPANRLAEVRNALTACGIAISDADILHYDRFEPGDFELRLLARLKLHGTSRVVLDVSTMSKLAIMLVLNTCHALNVRVRVLYSEADSYGPTRQEFEQAKSENKIHQPTLQIFTGVHGVVRVDSLASVAMQGQPTAAIVFMSFNDALTQVLLNTVYPSRLFLINGRPPIHRWREEATAWIHDQVRKEWEDDNPLGGSSNDGPPLPSRVASTLDYSETVALLLDLYWKLSVNHRILLAPAGSKLQSVGCYLVKALHPDIHIEYPSPEGFLPPYSTGIGPQWFLELGQVAARIADLSDAERREYLELVI